MTRKNTTPADRVAVEETPDGLVARETLDGAVARVARTYAAAEDDAIRRQLVALGWTPPGAAAPPAPSVVPEVAVEAAREALLRECDLADADMRKWVRVPVRYLRAALPLALGGMSSAEFAEILRANTATFGRAVRGEALTDPEGDPT